MRIPAVRMNLCRRICSTFVMTAFFATAVPLSAARGGDIPFRVSLDTVFQSSSGFPVIDITVQGEGQVQHLGNSATFSTNEHVNLITGNATATFTLVAANGDTVVFESVFGTVPVPGGVTFEGTYTVVGGTGRFTGSTGHGALTGSAQFTGPNNGVGEFTLDGTISSPGSGH